MANLHDLRTSKERYAYYEYYTSEHDYLANFLRGKYSTPEEIFKYQVIETNLTALISIYDITTTCEEVTSGNLLPGIAKLISKPRIGISEIMRYLDNLGSLSKEPMLRVLPFICVLNYALNASNIPYGLPEDHKVKLRNLAYTPLDELYTTLKDDTQVYRSLLQSFMDGTYYDLDLVYRAYRSRVPLPKEAN